MTETTTVAGQATWVEGEITPDGQQLFWAVCGTCGWADRPQDAAVWGKTFVMSLALAMADEHALGHRH